MGETAVAESGNWAIDVPEGTILKEGDKIFATQTTPNGQTSEKAETTGIAGDKKD